MSDSTILAENFFTRTDLTGHATAGEGTNFARMYDDRDALLWFAPAGPANREVKVDLGAGNGCRHRQAQGYDRDDK